MSTSSKMSLRHAHITATGPRIGSFDGNPIFEWIGVGHLRFDYVGIRPSNCGNHRLEEDEAITNTNVIYRHSPTGLS